MMKMKRKRGKKKKGRPYLVEVKNLERNQQYQRRLKENRRFQNQKSRSVIKANNQKKGIIKINHGNLLHQGVQKRIFNNF